MTRLIDADALIHQVESPYTEYTIMIQIRRAIKNFIKDAPTVDAVPVAWLQNHITTIEQQRLLDEWAEREEE